MPYMLQLVLVLQKPDGKWAAAVTSKSPTPEPAPRAMRAIALRDPNHGMKALLAEHTYQDSGDVVARSPQAQQVIQDVIAQLQRRGRA